MSAKNIRFFLQARLNSTRLPGKLLRRFSSGETLLELVIAAVSRSRFAAKDNVLVLTSQDPKDDPLVSEAARHGVGAFRGSEEDVLDRFYQASRLYPSEYIVRVCCDNPFLQSTLTDDLLEYAIHNPGFDYLSHRAPSGKPVIQTPLGLFVEVIAADALWSAHRHAMDPMDREHVTRYLYMHPDRYTIRYLQLPADLPEEGLRFTLDTLEDFENAEAILAELKRSGQSTEYGNLLAFLRRTPSLLERMNRTIALHKKS